VAEDRERLVIEAFVALSDTLVDEFDVLDFLHMLVLRCVDLLELIGDPVGPTADRGEQQSGTRTGQRSGRRNRVPGDGRGLRPASKLRPPQQPPSGGGRNGRRAAPSTRARSPPGKPGQLSGAFAAPWWPEAPAGNGAGPDRFATW